MHAADPASAVGNCNNAPYSFLPRSTDGLFELMRSRTGWLIIFCIGLLLAALVVEEFEDVLEKHVELSVFVPLIMGHGGNTGSQTVTTVVRALALKQVTHRDLVRVVLKEAGAGCLMGECSEVNA
jgi:Mg/Co/Ni transporter MgtE